MGALPAHNGNKLLSITELALPLTLFLLNLFTFIVWLVGMFQAWQGNTYQLPFVGTISEKITTPRLPKTQAGLNK